MPDVHARFSPSSFGRLIKCPASLKLCENVKDSSTEYSEMGTEAHALGEFFLKEKMGVKVKKINRSKLKYWSQEMEDNMKAYAEFVWDRFEFARRKSPDATLLVEQKVEIPGIGEQGDCFGTADVLLYYDNWLEVIDYKNGSTPVNAEENPQLMAYAYGAISDVEMLWGCENVRLTIYQPNINNVNAWETDKEHICDWFSSVLVKSAEEALSDDPHGEIGAHCKFCKAKSRCGFMAEKAYEVVKTNFRSPDKLIGKDQVSYFLTYGDAISDWLSRLKEWSLAQILQGDDIPGFKVVEGKSTRAWKDADEVAEVVEAMGFNPYKKPGVKGLGDMKKEVGNDNYKMLEENYTIKPRGVPTLVPASDKRVPYQTATDDFAEDINKEANNG